MNSTLLKKILTKCEVRWYQKTSLSISVRTPSNEVFKWAQNSEDDNIAPFVKPSFNLAAYANKSETLQKLLKLGIDLTKIEKRKGIPQFLLKLDFERDIKEHITFLNDLGLPASNYGRFFTTNPLFFKESIEDLGKNKKYLLLYLILTNINLKCFFTETRVFYLQSKKFNMDQIQMIISKNPFWLSLNTKRIDRRLGFFQKNFQLTGNDIRFVTTKQPNLITYNMQHIRENTFAIKEEMGFDNDEIKCLILSKPKIWMMSKLKLWNFDSEFKYFYFRTKRYLGEI